jgi:tetratricopeptide (TPR) repeat protein
MLRNDHVNFVNFQSSYEAIRISHSQLHFTHIIPARAVSGPGYFVETHLYVRDSSRLSPREQLQELLGYLEKMNACPYKNDTTHVTLLLAIEDAYFQQAEYLKALQYRREAINIIERNAGSPSIKQQNLPGNYYWLSVIYDSLNDVSKE